MTPSRSHAVHAAHELHLLTNPALWVVAIAAAFTMSTARAAGSPDNLSTPANAESMTPKQAYEHDRAYCNSGQVTENRALCLKEAERAYREARAGTLQTGNVQARSDRSTPSDMDTTSTSGTTAAASGSADAAASGAGTDKPKHKHHPRAAHHAASAASAPPMGK